MDCGLALENFVQPSKKTPPSACSTAFSREWFFRLNSIRFRANESLTIVSREQIVGSRRFGEGFPFGIEFQLRSHRKRILVEINAVLLEVLDGTLESREIVILAFDARENAFGFLDRDVVLLPKVVGDVSEMADTS